MELVVRLEAVRFLVYLLLGLDFPLHGTFSRLTGFDIARVIGRLVFLVRRDRPPLLDRQLKQTANLFTSKAIQTLVAQA